MLNKYWLKGQTESVRIESFLAQRSSQCFQNYVQTPVRELRLPSPNGTHLLLPHQVLTPVQHLLFFLCLSSPNSECSFPSPSGMNSNASSAIKLPRFFWSETTCSLALSSEQKGDVEDSGPREDGPNPLTSSAFCDNLRNHVVPELSNANFGRVVPLAS